MRDRVLMIMVGVGAASFLALFTILLVELIAEL